MYTADGNENEGYFTYVIPEEQGDEVTIDDVAAIIMISPGKEPVFRDLKENNLGTQIITVLMLNYAFEIGGITEEDFNNHKSSAQAQNMWVDKIFYINKDYTKEIEGVTYTGCFDYENPFIVL